MSARVVQPLESPLNRDVSSPTIQLILPKIQDTINCERSPATNWSRREQTMLANERAQTVTVVDICEMTRPDEFV